MNSILFFSLMNGAAWGGSEELWFQIAMWMAKNDYKVSICCYHWDKEEKTKRLKLLENEGCEIYLLPERKIIKKFYGKWKLKSVLKKIPFEHFDFVFISQGGWEEIVHMPFKHLYKRLKIFAICNHNYNDNDRLSGSKLSAYKKWILKACVNMAASEKIFEVLNQNLNITIPHQKIIFNPITFSVPKQVTPYPALQSGNYVWVVLAELDVRRKAQDVLIKVLSSEKWKNRNWVLHLYGKGKDEMLLNNLIFQYQLSNKVILKGFTNNVQIVLSNCHCLFQITHIDAMPISVVEALSMARPCVVSDVGDMSEWVKDGINGFVCKTSSESDIENVLEKCWQQKDSWELMGKKAFSTFAQKYPQPYEEKMVDILWQYYNTSTKL